MNLYGPHNRVHNVALRMIASGMDDRRDLFRTLCRLLARPYGPDDGLGPALDGLGPEAWSALVSLANRHYAAPRLQDGLVAAGFVPPQDEIAGYLEAIRAANAERNAAVREQIEAMLPRFNEAGIEPLLLKGTAWLFTDAGYGDSRMILDIDLLVPPGCVDESWRLLHGFGYRPADDDDYGRAHQLNALYREGAPATIEIHRTPGPQRTLLTTEEAFARAGRVTTAAGALRVLDPRDAAIHGIFHGQIQDFHFWFRRPQMRTLLDLRHLMATAGEAIDWPGIADRFDAAGYGDVLSGTVALLEDWLGARRPAAVPANAGFGAYVARCVARASGPQGEQTFLERWVAWAGVNLMPARLVYRHGLEDAAGWRRGIVILSRQILYLGRALAWPLRRLGRALGRG